VRLSTRIVDLPPLSMAALDAAEALGNSRWAFCGGTVINQLVEPRITKDVDVVTADRSSAISALLRSRKFRAEGGKLKHLSGGEIDVLNWESGNLDCPQLPLYARWLPPRRNRCSVGPSPCYASRSHCMKLGRAISNDRKAHQDKGDIINV